MTAFRAIAGAASLTAGLLAAAPAVAGSLTLNIHDVAHDEGKLWVEIFDGQNSWSRQAAVSQAIRPAAEGTVKVTFNGLEAGQAYAAWLYHDENGNRVLDRDEAGMPVEGWAMSTDFQPKSADWAFADFSFALDGEAVTHDVTMRY